MRRLAAALVIVSSGCAAASTPFMPLEVGRAWTYKLTSPAGSTTFSMSITKEDERGYAMPEPGGRVAHWRIEDGCLVLDRGLEIIPFFTVPPRTGVSWPITGEDEKTYYIKVRGYEDVTTPAGGFRQCLRVEMEDESREKFAVFHFARGVGLVRREERSASGTLILELTAAAP